MNGLQPVEYQEGVEEDFSGIRAMDAGDGVAMDASGIDYGSSGRVEGRPSEGQGTARAHALSPELRQRLAIECARISMEHLTRTGYMTAEVQEDLLKAYHREIMAQDANEPTGDVLTFLMSRMENSGEEEASRLLKEWTRVLRNAVPERKVTHLPFLQHTPTPQLYKDFPAVYEVCRTFRCPMVQANEKDFFSVASINPITAARVADTALGIIDAACGKLPITFVLTMNAEQYHYLNRKHFGS